ncbi:MAG TPA: proton-conducting transporter membrane subunit, partial [Vicinamibacteria bacterium]
HAWLPGAYSDAPSAVSALIAATTTKVAAYVLVRVMYFVFEPRFSVEMIPVTTLLSWMGVIAMILGSVMAIAQSDLKRMLAYSSVAQIGYIVLGIGLANAAGLTGGLLHLVNHALMKGCLFLVAGAIVYRTSLREIKDLRNLSVKMPWTAGIFAIAALSMIGIPPFCGFFSKLYLIMGAVEAGQWFFVGVILFSSALALAYFGNVIRYMYLPKEAPDEAPSMPVRNEAPWTMLAPMLTLAAAIVLVGLFNGAIVHGFLEHAVPAGLAGAGSRAGLLGLGW